MINKFVCVHILKTAGTTLRENLLLPEYKEKCLIDMSFKVGKRNRANYINFEDQPYPDDYKNYDVIFGHFKADKYVHLNRSMFSFVRHPVDRIISQHYHLNRMNVYKGRGPSLIEYSEQWSNHMTYVLGDISKYEFIGVVEEFDKSLKRMCDILGVRCPKNIISHRVSKNLGRYQISKKDRKEIEGMNLKDMDLYNKVIEKWG